MIYRPEKPPLHDDNAEQKLMGCALLAPGIFFEVTSKLGIGDDSFLDSRNRTIFVQLQQMVLDVEPIDPLSVKNWLE